MIKKILLVTAIVAIGTAISMRADAQVAWVAVGSTVQLVGICLCGVFGTMSEKERR